MSLSQLETLARAEALVLRGRVQDGGDLIALLGPDLPRFWEHFTTSPEYQDGAAHALDRWSMRVISALADATQGTPRFPFGGPPYEPFLTWAVQSGMAWPSPTGPLVHAEAGLFISYRGAIVLPGAAEPAPSVTRPCETCAQPCLTACPIGALSAEGYDVDACRTYVASADGALCRTEGCRTRHACPVGAKPTPAQAAFHMKAFLP